MLHLFPGRTIRWMEGFANFPLLPARGEKVPAGG